MSCNGYSRKGMKRQRNTRRSKARLSDGSGVISDDPAFGDGQHSYQNKQFTEKSNNWSSE